jgi:hypothetical protein
VLEHVVQRQYAHAQHIVSDQDTFVKHIFELLAVRMTSKRLQESANFFLLNFKVGSKNIKLATIF